MSSELQAQIIELEERLRQAMLNSDIDVLDELVAPGLLFTSHFGQLVSKEDDLALHRAGVLRLKELEPSQQHIQLYPGFAVVSVLMHLVGDYEGAPIDQNIRYTRIWSISSSGSIQIVAGHMSEVKLVYIDLEHLRSAISVAWQARDHGNHPFGAVLVNEYNQVLLQAENTVTTGRDSTGHAETNLVRLATQNFSPEQLARSTLYSSTEPCAMCAGAIHWSQIGRVVYALSEVDLYAMIGPSPEHLLLPCREVFAHSQRRVEVHGPIPALEIEARLVHENFWTIPPQDNHA